MRTKQIKILLFLALSLFAVIAWGQTNTNGIPSTGVPITPGKLSDLWLVLIPVGVPLVVTAIKHYLPLLPSWLVPILATALGQLANWISGMAGGPSTTALNGVLLGASSVGLREILDQLNQKRKESKE